MTITREIIVTYNSYTIGGSSVNQPIAKYRHTDDYDSASFSIDFSVTAASPSALATAVAAAQIALRKPRQDLVVTTGGGTLISWKQSDNTGFDCDPSCEKIGHPLDSGCRQILRFSVTCGRPADNLGLAGRRKSDISVEYNEGLTRTVEFTGEYTATSTNSATTNYDNGVATYCEGILTALTGNYVLAAQSSEYFETDKVLSFRRVYQEVVDSITVTYNSQTLGGAVANYVIPSYQFSTGYEVATFTCDVVIRADTAAALATTVANLQTALRVPRKKLEVKLSGTTVISWDHTGNTGLDTDPTCDKASSPDDSDTRHTIRFTVRCGMPADNLSLSGRRKSTISVSYDEVRARTLEVSGEYTCLSGNSATAQYASAASTYLDSVLTTHGGSWNMIDENYEYFETDKVLSFKVRYKEIIYREAGTTVAAPNNSSIISQSMSIVLQRQAKEPSKSPASGYVYFHSYADVQYTAKIEKTATILDLVTSVIKPYIEEHVRLRGGGTQLLIMDSVEPNYDESTVSIRQRWQLLNTSEWSEYTYTETVEKDYGLNLVPVWDEVDTAYVRYQFQGPRYLYLRIQESGEYLKAMVYNGETYYAPSYRMPQAPSGHEWVLTRKREAATPKIIGLSQDGHHQVGTMYDRYREYEAVKTQLFTEGSGTLDPLIGY